ncbi:MAG: CotH kinase family protein [Candidatus Hinthialibacter antarcticus]|nr:CotH kinase family protein [Candidatus Hinthialibacter antarcticus]
MNFNVLRLASSRWVFVIAFLVLFSSVPASYSQIQINELLASTSATTQDGAPLEWLELHNAGDAALDLTGYALSDDLLIPFQWLLPSLTLQPDDYLLIYTTGLNTYSADEFHANFRLNRDGETISLTAPNGVLLDRVSFPLQERDVSYGRDPAVPAQWRYFSPPSPGQGNSNNGAMGFVEPADATLPAGRYDAPVTIQFLSPQPDAEIRYTVDGSEPTQTSQLYSAPIAINQTIVLRSRTYLDGFLPSHTSTQTYIIRDNIDRPILSLSTNPENLWDRNIGIYANATASGDAWERPVHMEYFAPMGTLLSSEDAGIRMHGGASRNRAEKKSFRLYFRSDYGPARLDAPVISDALDAKPFDKLVLRAGYNDSWIHWSPVERDLTTYVYDQLCRNLSGDMGAPYSRGDFADLYLNGEYWGFYNISERVEGDMLEPFYGTDEWIVVKDEQTAEGDPREWSSLRSFLQRANFTNDDDYQAIQQMVDLQQLTDYYILNIWVSNTDWPTKNFYAARESSENGRWRFIIWDIEWSFGAGGLMGTINANAFQNARSNNGTLGTMLDKLLRRDEYQQYFLDRLEHNIATVLSNSHVNQRFDELLERVRAFMPRESERWDPTRSLETFDSAIAAGKRFIDRRTDTVRQHIYGYLNAPTPTPMPDVPLPTPTPGGAPTATPTRIPTVPPTPTPTPTIPVTAQLGIFEGNLDIGNVEAAGQANYRQDINEYRVSGSGVDVWGVEDEFHFVYKQVEGPFVFDAQADAINHGTSDWAKVMLMARESLASDAENFAVRIRESIMEISSQWRLAQGETSFSTSSAARVPSDRHDGRIRIVRENDIFQSFYFDTAQSDWVLIDEVSVPMSASIYVGLAVTSHEDGSLAEGVYRFVNLQSDSPVMEWSLHHN